MGGSISTTSTTNEMVNEQMAKVMTSISSSCDMSSSQGQSAIITGNKDADVEIDQNMLLKVLATCEITNDITTEIKNNIDTFLKEKIDVETGAPLVGLNYTDVNFLNKIRNTIKTEITTTTVSKIMQSVKASQDSIVSDNVGGKYKVTQQMTGDIILKALITNKVINNALNELKAQIEIDAKIANKGFDLNSLFKILIVLCIIIGFYYGLPIISSLFSKNKKNNDDRYDRYDDRNDRYDRNDRNDRYYR